MKINQLLQAIPSGAVVTTTWLAAHEVSADQARKLAGSGWLRRVGHGAYSRPGDALSWESAVFALQAHCEDKRVSECEPAAPRFWPGGPSALGLHGLSHYLPMGRETLHLFTAGATRLPRWLMTADWVGHVEVHAHKGLSPAIAGSFAQYQPPGKPLTILTSAPERAILEWIAITPDELLFSSALVDTFTGLSALRPRVLQALLEHCGSVRTKRVLLLLARHAGHAWYSRLDRQRFDLGTGKRQLCPGGRLDREYQVTVPEAFADGA